ncbi:MAG: immunoglobulin domain-containing protein, partial [Odoribacter sp.]
MSAKKFCILILVFLQALTAFGKQQYVSDSVLLSARPLPLSLLALPPVVGSGDLYRGGADDGFAASCLLPIVIEYGQQNIECINDSIVMWIKADGTEREYKWQKYDANAFHDLENNLYLTGVKTDRLVVRTPDKLRDDGVYRCVVFNGCGETLSDTFRVAMSSAPQLVSSIGSSVSWECAGHRSRNLAIAVSCLDEKLLSYTWWKLDTVTGERILFDLEKHNTGTLTIQPLSLEDEGLYGVTVSNECGTLRDSAFMPVYMPVTVETMNVIDHKIIACEGDSVDLRVKVAGGGVYHYTLKKVRVTNTNPLVYQDIATLSTGQSQYTINGVDKSMVGEYVWEVENNCGRDTSEVSRLEVHQHPDFTAGKEFPDTLVCEGAKVVLSCEAVGENVKYYWYHNGEPTPIVGNILQIDTLNAEQAGNYICYAHNVCLRHSSARPIQVTLDPLPDIMRQPLLLKPVCVGDSLVEINIRFGNVTPDSVRWRFNDHFLYDDEKKIAGSTLNKLSIFNIKPEEIGYYYVQAYNRCGSVISEAAELKLNEPARIIKGLNGYNMLLCAGEDQQLMINATGTMPLRYRWLCNDRVFATSEENIVHVKAGDINVDAQYCVQVENMCGSEVQCSFLKVAKIQTFKIEGGGEYCDGHNATGAFNMIGSDTNVMYSLYRDPDEKMNEFKGTGDTIQFKEMASGHYYITGLDSNGCVQQMKNPVDVILKPSPASGRLVMLNESCQNNPGANLVMTNWEDKVQYKLYRKYKTADYEWYKYLMFLGGSVNSPQPGEVKEWNGLDEGRYKVVAQNLMNGCTRDMVLDDSVILRPAPRRYNLLAVHNDLINCSLDNELVQLEADAYENGSEYILKKEGVAYGQSLRYSPIRWSLLGGGSYTLLVKNQWGCMSESKPVKVVDALTPTQVKISGNGAICDGDVSTYKELIVEKSELDVTYRLLKDFPERLIEEKKGTGSDMKFILPLSNATYIVDAYDATGQCKVRLEDRFLVGASKFQAVTVPAELFLDRGGRTHLHVDVSGTYAQPMAIEWKPKEMIEWGLVTSPTTQWHKQYYIPFCPCQCSLDYPNYHEYVHGPQCASNPTSCPYLYHTWDPKKYGCIYQKTERILWRGEMRKYYDLYYCPKSFQDDYQITNETEGTPNPFKDPTTVPIYQDITYQVTATDALGCSKMDEVKVKVTGKKLDAEIIFSKEHKHFYVPFCPCGCSDKGGYRHDTHGPGCNDTNCWLFYHSHTHSGCSFQKTEKIFYEGSWRNYYDLYYCCTGIEAVDTMVYRNDEQFFCSSVDGGDYTYKYAWSFVTADGVGTVFPEGKEHVQFQARESGYLYLDVTSMGQHKKDSIWIEVLRKPLKAEIRNSECELRVDSVSLCIGERTELCGWAEGGDGPHTYRWYDREHDLASLNHVIYKPEKSDYVWFLTVSDGVEVLDSVFIKLSPSPQKVAIDVPGVRCVQLDQEEVIRMPKTQKGMNYILEYRAPGLANREYGQRYNNAQGDALAFSVHQPVHDPGMYRVRVDHIIGDKVCSIYLDSIEFIAPPTDAEIVDTTYCFGDFGVALQLKSVADNMQYSIVSAKGTVLETIKKPEVQFHKLYTQAPYFFRMERLGELGSCWLERPFQVSRAQDPDISLAVVANAHGPVCEGSEITITVLKTEKGVKYELISPTNRVEDMLMGSGLDESFKAFPRPAGIYMIRATRGNCDVYLDQSVKVNPLPRNLDISDIHYCVTPPQQAVQVKTTVEVGGLQTNVRYYLRLKNVDLDSVEGPGIKTFEKQQTAGEYQILAKDLTTQCVSPVNVFHIVGDRGPY